MEMLRASISRSALIEERGCFNGANLLYFMSQFGSNQQVIGIGTDIDSKNLPIAIAYNQCLGMTPLVMFGFEHAHTQSPILTGRQKTIMMINLIFIL